MVPSTYTKWDFETGWGGDTGLSPAALALYSCSCHKIFDKPAHFDFSFTPLLLIERTEYSCRDSSVHSSPSINTKAKRSIEETHSHPLFKSNRKTTMDTSRSSFLIQVLLLLITLALPMQSFAQDRQVDVGTTRVEFVGRSGQLRFCKLDDVDGATSCQEDRFVQLSKDESLA